MVVLTEGATNRSDAREQVAMSSVAPGSSPLGSVERHAGEGGANRLDSLAFEVRPHHLEVHVSEERIFDGCGWDGIETGRKRTR